MALPVTLVTLGGVPVELVDQTGSVFPTTGTGSLVFNTTPTLVTPILGIATGTSLALGGATIGSNALAVTGTASFGGAVLVGEAANILAQRNSTSAQTFRLYNTYTDASNYERVDLTYATNVATLQSVAAGTGTARNLSIIGGGSGGSLTLLGGGTTLDVTSNSINMYRNGSSNTTTLNVSGTSLTSTVQNFARLTPTINQASGTYTILDINPTETAIGAGPHYLIQGRLGGGALASVFGIRNTGAMNIAGALTVGSTTLITSSVAFTNGAAAAVGTLTNAPAAGNPTKWVPINDNGTTRYIPAW